MHLQISQQAKIPTAQRGSSERIPSCKACFLEKAVSQHQLFENARGDTRCRPQFQQRYLNADRLCQRQTSRKQVPLQKLHVNIPLRSVFSGPEKNRVRPFHLLIVLIFPAVVFDPCQLRFNSASPEHSESFHISFPKALQSESTKMQASTSVSPKIQAMTHSGLIRSSNLSQHWYSASLIRGPDSNTGKWSISAFNTRLTQRQIPCISEA